MSRHRAPRSLPYGRIAAVVAGLVVVLLAVVGGIQLLGGDDAPEQAGDQASSTETAGGAGDDAAVTSAPVAGCEEPQEIVLVTTTAMAGPLGEAVAAAEPECLAVEVEARSPAEVSQQLTESARGSEDAQGDEDAQGTEDAAPLAGDVWVPDSTLWPELLAEGGLPVEVGPVVATSPVVLAGPADLMAQAAAAPAWSDLLGSTMPLKAANPRMDAPSLLTLLSAQAAFGDDDAGQQAATQTLVRLGQDLRPAEELQEQATSGEPVVFPSSEQVVAASDGALGAVVPEGGLGVLSYPLVALPGSDAGAEAVQALGEALGSDAARESLASAGFRPGEDGAAPGVEGVPDTAPALADQPSATVVAAATESWARITQAQRMLAIIDVSGSMREAVGEDTRIGIATAAAEEALLNLMRPESLVGLWEFSTDRGEDGQHHLELAPVRALDSVVDGTTHAERLRAAVRSMTAETVTGDTALHDTILAAFQEMQEQFDPGYVNSVVLLTDGVNDNPDGGLTEGQLVSELERLADPERPVTVVLVGMGPSVDGGALQRIAEATGGRAYVAEDPADIATVFVDAVMNREG